MHLSHQPDTRPHSSIQTWSRGDIFPAVIKRVETYDNLHHVSTIRRGADYALRHRQRGVHWTVILHGVETDHATYDAAYDFAADAVKRAEREAATDAAIATLGAARRRAFERNTQIGEQAAKPAGRIEYFRSHQERPVQAETERDTDGNPLQPGALYCERDTDYYGEGEHRYGQLLWYGGKGRFFDADTEEEVNRDGDYDGLVRQRVTVNVLYVA